MMNTKAHIQQARMKEGRKIDSWRFTLPEGGPAEFAIHLVTKGNQMWFTAQTDHPLFRAIIGSDTDLEKLRDKLEESFRDELERQFGTDWQPATMLEVSVSETDRRASSYSEAEKGVTIKMRSVPLRLDATKPQGNLGETRVIMRESPQTVIQRSRTDRYQVDKGLDARNMMFNRENDDDISRVVLPDHQGQAVDMNRLREAMARFGQNLADACSPQSISMRGVPAPEDLVRIMQASVESEPDGLGLR